MTEIPSSHEFELEQDEVVALSILYDLYTVDGLLFAVEDKEGNWSEMLCTLKKLEALGLVELISVDEVELNFIDEHELVSINAHKFKLTTDMGLTMMTAIMKSGIEVGEVLLRNTLTNQMVLFKFNFKADNEI